MQEEQATREKLRPEAAHEGTRRRRRRGFGGVRLVIAVLLAALIGAGVMYFSQSTTRYASQTLEVNLKDIGELATQAGYYTNINTINNSNRTILGVPIPFTSSRALCSYSGTIKAGLDFGGIRVESDAGKKLLRLTLPPIRVLSNEIDLESLKIFDEGYNLFNQIRIESMNQSLIVMKQEAEDQAIAQGLLTAARNNAEKLIRSLLRGIPELKDYQCEFVWEGELTDGEV